jgi:tetratricopeptide (TPR) repeat protein
MEGSQVMKSLRSNRWLSSTLLVGVSVVFAACAEGPTSQTPPQPPAEAPSTDDTGEPKPTPGTGEATANPDASASPGQAVVAPESASSPPAASSPVPSSPSATAAIPAAPVMNPQAQASFDQGLAAFKNADLNGALQAFTAATRADARAYRAQYALGTVHERLGSVSAAMAAYEQSYAIQPDFTDGIVAHARLLAEGGSLSEAERLLTQRRSTLPKSAAIVSSLAEVKSLMRDSATAQQFAQDALKLDSKYTPAMLVIARDHYRARRLDLALYALKAILDGFGEANPPRDKDSAEARLLRATIWLEQDRRVMAMNEFKAVMDLRPDLVTPRLRYATYLLESGGARDAIPLLQGTLQYDSNNLAAHLSLGDAYRLTGDFAKARQEFDWVRQQNPSLPAVHYNTGLLFLFAPSMAGMTPREQVEAAMAALTKFKELASKAEQGDVDELLKRASLKKVEIDAIAAANAPPPPPPPPPPPADGAVPPPGNGAVPPAPANGGN